MNENFENRDSLEKIVGRSREKRLLQDLLESRNSEFIAIYGRRRVGKTYLVKNFISTSSYVFFHVIGIQKGSLKSQLDEFSKQIGKAFYQGASIISRSNWMDAFEDITQAIAKIPQNKKIVLFFDELPWMTTPRSKLLTALELYWNRYWVFDERCTQKKL